MSQQQFERFQESIKNKVLTPFREHLKKRFGSLLLKRVFDIIISLICIIIPLPFYILAAVAIKLGSNGPVFYRQLRVGKDCKPFYVLKFRTMRIDADKKGEITVGSNDARITEVGKILRTTNFDEFPQFLQVFAGSMSIIGIRPEVPHYVECYTLKDFATLLMKPGMTSPVAIKYRHENDMLAGSSDPERTYIEEILPAKMKINRDYVAHFSFLEDMKILGRTFKCLFEKDEAIKNKANT